MINGLVPSKPNATSAYDKGSKLVLYYGLPTPRIDENMIIGEWYADKKGEVRANVPRVKTGEVLSCRTFHAGYIFQDESFPLMPYGAFHTSRLVKDRVWSGQTTGNEIADIASYRNQSVGAASNYRNVAFQRMSAAGKDLSEIPFLFWGACYGLGVFTFALDYWLWGTGFDTPIESWIDALYLSVVTVTTLGYGDITPVDTWPKVLTGLQSLSGIALAGLFLNSLFAGR